MKASVVNKNEFIFQIMDISCNRNIQREDRYDRKQDNNIRNSNF